MRAALALAAALALLFAGCGGSDKPNDTEQIEAVLKTYYEAFGTGDSASACNALANETREELEKAAGGKDCEKVLEAALKRPDYAKVAPKLKGVEITEVHVAMDKATARATVPGVGKPTVIPLKKEANVWKIASPVGE